MRFRKSALLVVLIGLAAALLLWPYKSSRPEAYTAWETPSRVEEPPALDLDQYGGIRMKVSKATGYFRVEKIGNRWVFLTPEGNPFWMRSVQATAFVGALDPTVIQTKYGGRTAKWFVHRNERLVSYGFNTLGEYVSSTGLPIDVYGGVNASPVKMPFILILNVIDEAMKEGVKSLMDAVPTSRYNGYRAKFPDAYDPKFATAASASYTYWDGVFNGGVANKAWIVGITPDDADSLFGFKSGGTAPAPLESYPNDAWFIAVSMPQFSSNADKTNYTKLAWITFLKAKYANSVTGLNTAWTTSGFYTSFDSAGGYGTGTGVLDEDGRHSWVGTDSFLMSNASAGFRADVNAFLYEYVKKYQAVITAAIRAKDANHLIFGPDEINNYGVKSRDEVLRGLADGGADVLIYSYDSGRDTSSSYCSTCLVYPPRPAGGMADNNKSYDVTGKPAYIWYGIVSNADSPFAGVKTAPPIPDFSSQSAKGAQMRDVDVPAFLNAKGANGDYYVVGLDWWGLLDNPSEGIQWGLWTLKDNAYNGKEAVMAPGKDPWGFPTGGERTNYGDFLSHARQANFQVMVRLKEELSAREKPVKDGTGKR